MSLENILIPVATAPSARPAVEAAARLAARLHSPRGTFTLLHIGESDAMPAVERPDVP